MPRHPHESMNIMAGQDQSSRATQMASQTVDTLPSENLSAFVFPAFQDPATMQDTYQRQQESSGIPAGSRRPATRSRPKDLSINALPAFEFGAGSASSESTQEPPPSPTRSPVRRTPPIPHASGHRRGNSEFVGGDLINPITAGVGPHHGEELPSLLVKPSGPPKGRRGHAHRRSGALSQHDLSMILKPSNDNRAGSAPTTPCDLSSEFPRPTYFGPDRSLSQPASTTFSKDRSSSPSREHDEPPRSRVTFNNDPEYIPRPLSTISSDTSSSMSTVRANHSMTDSITSLVSGNTSSPASSRTAKSGSGSIDYGNSRHRARSSGSVPNNTQPDQALWDGQNFEPRYRRPSAPLLEVEAEEIDSDFGTPFQVSESTLHSDLGAYGSSGSVNPTVTTANPDLAVSPPPFESRQQRNSTSNVSVARPRTSPEPKSAKRQTKVKSWAGSILSRKTKHPLEDTSLRQEGTSTPSPPPLVSTEPSSDVDFPFANAIFDEDRTCIISRPQSPPRNTYRGSTTYSAFNEYSITPPIDDESSMLDIDAALASLDRPVSSSDGNSTVGSTKRRMHSSGETGGFTGPGGHYHRRAESAPELDYFEYNRLGFAHRGSNPAMAEAIEEEEEEEDQEDREAIGNDTVEGKHKTRNASHFLEQETGLGVNIVESDHSHNEPVRRRTRRSDDFRNESISPKSHAPGPQHIWGGVEIVSADEEPRSSVITKSSDDSTITPTLSPEPHPRIRTPFDTVPNTPMFSAAGEVASTVSSPDHGKTSFDHHEPHRIHTATSSITDRVTVSSSRTGENGHGSVDDVPSLTSSASTMISGHPTRFSSSANTTASFADRSSSLSAAVPARTSVRPGSSKRSSLASLSRLVGGSYNRSKLNIAELARPDTPERLEKKKSKRLSRLMFWKSKEKLAS